MLKRAWIKCLYINITEDRKSGQIDLRNKEKKNDRLLLKIAQVGPGGA